MLRPRPDLPQLADRPFLTDGGLETTLVFHRGLTLPGFAAFPLLDSATGTDTLRRYYRAYGDLATRHGCGLVLESATWRANPDWGARLGYEAPALAEANRRAIALLHELRDAYQTDRTPVVVSGCVGPRGDGYRPDTMMTAADAADYHRPQLAAFAEAGADMACAMTMTDAHEATGVAWAAREVGLPVALSFTLETDGRLPSGQSLAAAVAQVEADTTASPAYYMVNCAHPTHIAPALADGGAWMARVRGLRANASRMSHAELDEAPTLDAGDPAELGREYAWLLQRLPRVTVFGGCCGTDDRHVAQIAAACLPRFAPWAGAAA